MTWFLSRNHRRKAGRTFERMSRFLPRLEVLENRTVPSTLTVTNTLDKGAGSLRDTISKAKDGDTIVFASSLNGQTITLISDQLEIKKSLDIEGPGADKLAVSGNDTSRVFDISEGNAVTIAGLTITHGRAAGNGGGGILNVGSALLLANDVLSYNTAAQNDRGNARGGAVANYNGGALTATGSTFVLNQAVGAVKEREPDGGAIFNATSTTLVGCTFTANRSIVSDGGILTSGFDFLGVAGGGAITNSFEATLTVVNSTFTGNQAIAGSGGSAGTVTGVADVDTGYGGAIENYPTATLSISGSTFAYNRAIGGSNGTAVTSSGVKIGAANGGVLDNEGVATITNSTFAYNQALGGNGNTGGRQVGAALGGAIRNIATLRVDASTFTGNRAVGSIGNTGGVLVGDSIGGALANICPNLNVGTVPVATVSGSTFTGNQAIGGQGSTGGNGGDALGGGLANLLGATLTVSTCTLTSNQATGGAGGAGANGGNGFGCGLYNDGRSTLTVLPCTITDNQATGGAAGSGGSGGHGEGGGLYLDAGGAACLDAFTVAHVMGNHAYTSDDDVFGTFTTC